MAKPCLLVRKFLTNWRTGEQVLTPLSPRPVLLKILQISGRKNCNEMIFALENEIFRCFQLSRIRRTRRRIRLYAQESFSLLGSPRFFRQSVAAKPCDLLPLWICTPPKVLRRAFCDSSRKSGGQSNLRRGSWPDVKNANRAFRCGSETRRSAFRA